MRTSFARVTDQNPSSSWYSLISDQWTGHPPQLAEHLVRRALLPVLAIGDVDPVELLVGLRGHPWLLKSPAGR